MTVAIDTEPKSIVSGPIVASATSGAASQTPKPSVEHSPKSVSA